jgi:hypothetical protein
VWGGWIETEVTEHRLAISSDAGPLCSCNDVFNVAKKSWHRGRQTSKGGGGQGYIYPGKKVAPVLRGWPRLRVNGAAPLLCYTPSWHA